MKFGISYAYWSNKWSADYMHFARKIKGLGFDILEVPASDLLKMSDKELTELKAQAADLGIDINSNIGPPREFDVASSDPATRAKGVEFLSNINEENGNTRFKRLGRRPIHMLAG